MNHLKSMNSLFEHELNDLYSAESQIIEALPKMVKAASSEELQIAFQQHLAVTEEQRKRLKNIFTQLKLDPGDDVCEGMKGLLEEAKEAVDAKGDSHVKDAALISAAQRVEHYEIAAYGTAREFARVLGYDVIARMLDMTLHEEGDADKELSRIGSGTFFETGINETALR